MSLMLWKTRQAELDNVFYPAIKELVTENKGSGYYQKMLSLLELK